MRPATGTSRRFWATLGPMIPLLSLIALVLVIAGIVKIVKGDILVGVILIVLACAVGPGGWSIVA